LSVAGVNGEIGRVSYLENLPRCYRDRGDGSGRKNRAYPGPVGIDWNRGCATGDNITIAVCQGIEARDEGPGANPGRG